MFAVLLCAGAARAAWPDDVDLYGMVDQDGEPVLDREVLGRSYRQLVMELGTMVANKPALPADTVGAYGFDVDVSAQFALTEAHFRDGEPSPWNRADTDESTAAYHVIPTVTVRKGLPLSTEVGASMGWIGASATGTFGGFARVAVFEGYKPLPDVSLKLGYAGYVGNDQLDCGALDLSVTLGSTYAVGRIPEVNTGEISPWMTLALLRVSANATIDEEVEDQIGALRYSRSPKEEDDEAPIAIPQFGGGVQFVSGNAHIRVAASWAPATIPVFSTGFGFTF